MSTDEHPFSNDADDPLDDNESEHLREQNFPLSLEI